jgi:leucyl/phenylalanyl-tRNA--protein transferase
MEGGPTPEFLLRAYADGYFPMAESRHDADLRWFNPEARGILPLDAFHVPRRLARLMRRRPFRISVNEAFGAVIRACAEREDTWINDTIIALYTDLHERGFAHSVECWQSPLPTPLPCTGEGSQREALAGEGDLVGGIYGIALGGAFFGESMFSRAPNASKAALAYLANLLKEAGYTLFDAQFVNAHLRQFGAMEISREEYLERLKAALSSPPNDGVWHRIMD